MISLVRRKPVLKPMVVPLSFHLASLHPFFFFCLLSGVPRGLWFMFFCIDPCDGNEGAFFYWEADLLQLPSSRRYCCPLLFSWDLGGYPLWCFKQLPSGGHKMGPSPTPHFFLVETLLLGASSWEDLSLSSPLPCDSFTLTCCADALGSFSNSCSKLFFSKTTHFRK